MLHLHPHVNGGINFSDFGENFIPYIQLATIECGVQGVGNERLLIDLSDFQQPPEKLSAVVGVSDFCNRPVD